MKKNYLFLRKDMWVREWLNAFCLSVLLVSAISCAQGHDAEVYSGSVTGVTLESPDPGKVTFTKVAGTTTVKIEWPVIYGAGGYEFSLYIVDDPDHPILVGKENEFIDGCFAVRDYLEETKYVASIKTLGSEKYDNKGSLVASESNWSTYLPATVIPNGSDLTKYFASNPIAGSEDIGFELVAGGNYEITGEISFGTANVTLRGDKINRPTVVAKAGFKSQGGGSIIKCVNFECSEMTSKMFYGFDDIPAGSTLVSKAFVVNNPIMFQSCNIAKLSVPLYFDDGKAYAVHTLLIDDCVVELTNNGRFIQNSATDGSLKDFIISNSTVYKNNAGTDYWMQLSGQRIANITGWGVGSLTYRNNTFYRFDRFHNSNNYSQAYVSVTIENNIYLDFLRVGAVQYTLPAGNLNNNVIKFDNNTYWRNGAVDSYSNYDKSGSTLDEDPKCKSPSTGDFTVGNPNTIAAGIGDPRWFPAQ